MTKDVTMTIRFRVYSETQDGIESIIDMIKNNVHEELWQDDDVQDLEMFIDTK